MKNNTDGNRDAVTHSPRAAKLLGRDEDFREITYWFGESFKRYARIQNRKNRRAVRRLLDRWVA